MPLDKFFSSSYKGGRNKRKHVAARVRLSWPADSQYSAQVALEMRLRGSQPQPWIHFINVPQPYAESELCAWRQGNPEWEFRLGRETKRAKRALAQT